MAILGIYVKSRGGPFCCLYFNPTSCETTSSLVTAEFRVFCCLADFRQEMYVRHKNQELFSTWSKKKQLVQRNEGIVAVWVFGVLGHLMVD